MPEPTKPTSSLFKSAPPVVDIKVENPATLAADSMADITASLSEGEHLSNEDAVKVENIKVAPQPSLAKELDKVLGKAKNSETKIESRTLSSEDLENLNETTLMDFPITAKSLNDDASQVLKPKDSSKALRWVYWNNGLIANSKDKTSAVNVGRYKRWGFEFAAVEDIQGGEDALVEGIIDDGGKIINYDTVLMIVDKIRLMSHYKKNLINSMDKVNNALGRAKKAAEGEVASSTAYSRTMATHPQAKIEFFSTTDK